MAIETLPAALRAENLGYAYGDKPVLAGVDLELHSGQFMAVIGPNGSGKSTLLGLLGGLLRPKRGRVYLHGRDMNTLRRDEIAGALAIVPQAPELNPGLTVMETALSGRFARMKGRMFENRIDLDTAWEALKKTGLADMAARKAGELSGGERQRLSLARALAAEPGILLLDEPTSALDLDHQVKIMGLLEEDCRRRGLAVCLVSHDLNLAALFSGQLVLLRQGRVLARGGPEEVLRPDTLAGAFGVRTLVDREPTRGRPRITLVPPAPPGDGNG